MLLLTCYVTRGQPNFPDDGFVFDDTSVPRIDITIDPDTLEWIYNHVESNIEWHATFQFTRGWLTETMDNVGFRLRGNTSRYSAKKSFKISFNTFEPGQKWYGLEKLNLNGEHNDPSICRSKLAWDLLRAFGIPAPRSNHVRVYINGNYYGLYINVEHIDEEFVDLRFGNQDGNLFKCLYPADLKYLGSNPELYKFQPWGDRRTYDLKTNTYEDDYTDLAHFINILNNSTQTDFYCELEEVFNLQDYLKIIVTDIFLGNWDGYLYNKNNFYLYHNTQTGKFEYIPYDLDNTFGIDWFSRDWGTRDIYDWEQHGSEVRPLYTRIMDNQDLKDQYSYYWNKFFGEVLQPETFNQRADELKNLILPYVSMDPFYPLDYGYTLNDFINSFEQAIGAHVKYGVKPYVSTRYASALEQLELNNIHPLIKYINYNYPTPGESVWVTALLDDDNSFLETCILYSLDGSAGQKAFLLDDGSHHDGEAGDRMYGGYIPGIPMNSTLSFQVSATDLYGFSSILPCQPVEITLIPSTEPALFINEFMADNTSFLADESGEFDDWIEIYNGDMIPVWLGDKYLSDNLSNPGKWKFPDVTLQPGEFLLIWADDQPGQGNLHASFKLSKEGEEIGLFDSEATAFQILDSIVYSVQVSNQSYGRLPDGGLSWKLLDTPTPGYSNISGSLHETGSEIFRVYPNPLRGDEIHFSKPLSAGLFNSRGEIIGQFSGLKSYRVNSLPAGIYFLVTDTGLAVKLVRIE